MTEFIYDDIKLHLYEDTLEFVKTNIEKDAVAVEEWDTIGGFASIFHKEIMILCQTGFNFSFETILTTVAHELGHIITGGFTENPPEDDEEMNETKARHYEDFCMLAFKMATDVNNHLIAKQ